MHTRLYKNKSERDLLERSYIVIQVKVSRGKKKKRKKKNETRNFESKYKKM